VGLGYKRDGWWVDFFYIAGFYQDRVENNQILPGTYQSFTNYRNMSLEYWF